jgi:UTP--glucose-1-phosphate uridylyltransferase
MKIKKAVIPAAGLGSRMLPLTSCLPKEILPIGNRPMIQFALEEALAAGVDEIFIIIDKKRKHIIKDYFNNFTTRDSDPYALELTPRNLSEKCQLTFINQAAPLGLVDAVQKVEAFIAEEPFFLLLPDNVYFGRPASTAQLLECFSEYNHNILGLIEVTKDEAGLFGNCGKVRVQNLKNDFFLITNLQDKAPGTFDLGGLDKALRSCGRYILGPEFFHETEKMKKDGKPELDDVPILQNLIQKQKMLGVVLKGRLFDCGHWEGYWAANRYWMDNRAQWN